ncbi:hypothetical protein RF11_03181 [Thelohanellus kitauei]|uniref:Uncharacterized protein n=1 Tax=Thelohanellus kitauei TaxID=669202 RepID=A0A0C2MS17_THEKT|nr:hypothetical protein RF11_03181 [Thelohanellus kitauei]
MSCSDTGSSPCDSPYHTQIHQDLWQSTENEKVSTSSNVSISETPTDAPTVENLETPNSPIIQDKEVKNSTMDVLRFQMEMIESRIKDCLDMNELKTILESNFPKSFMEKYICCSEELLNLLKMKKFNDILFSYATEDFKGDPEIFKFFDLYNIEKLKRELQLVTTYLDSNQIKTKQLVLSIADPSLRLKIEQYTENLYANLVNLSEEHTMLKHQLYLAKLRMIDQKTYF